LQDIIIWWWFVGCILGLFVSNGWAISWRWFMVGTGAPLPHLLLIKAFAENAGVTTTVTLVQCAPQFFENFPVFRTWVSLVFWKFLWFLGEGSH
jgi:uncharacterized membrane protein